MQRNGPRQAVRPFSLDVDYVDFDGNRRSICRMDAEAMVEDLNRMPSGKGSWLRCLEVDHSRSYETQFKDWDACIWFHRGIGMKKMVRSNGGCDGLHGPASVQMALPEQEADP